MKIRDQIVACAAAAGMVVSAGFARAADTAPLPAGGPVAQSTAGSAGLKPGTIIEVGGVLLAATVAGLIAINSDDNSTSATKPTISTTPSTGTTSGPSTSTSST